MKFSTTAILLATAIGMTMAMQPMPSPRPDMEICSEENNDGKCASIGKEIDDEQVCFDSPGPWKCSTSHCCKDKNTPPPSVQLTCSESTNQDVCSSRGHPLNKGKKCNRNSPDKCASSHCCGDDDEGEDDLECSEDTNNGKCDRLGKDIDEGKSCNRYNSNKCSSSYCCKSKSSSGGSSGDKKTCSSKTNKGKCDRMGKDIDEGKSCDSNGDRKCSSSYCCE